MDNTVKTKFNIDNFDLEELKKFIKHKNLNEIYDIEKSIIKSTDIQKETKLNIIRDYVHNNFLLTNHC